MGLETRYPELIVLAQFFPSEGEVFWKKYETPFSHDVDVLYVYGFSPYVGSLLDWLQQNPKRQLVFLEDRVDILIKIQEEKADGILKNEQMHLKFHLGDVTLEEFIVEVIQEFPVDKIAVISLREEDEKFEAMKKLLFRKATLFQAVFAELLYYPKVAHNVLKSFQRLQGAFDIGAWKDRFKDVPAVVCGAGPSLQTVQNELKSVEEKALILAGGSAISALTKGGILPHLLFAIDPNPEEFTRLAFHTAYQVPLIFGSRVEPHLFYAHAGPLGYLSTGTGGGLEKWLEEQIGIRDYKVLQGIGEEALSVTAITFMMALYLGCNPIVLAGIDLAYDHGKRYTAGVLSDLQCSLEEKPQIVGDTVWKEEELSTVTKWIMERDVLDAVCKDYPDRTFLKASSQGLLFNHIVYDPTWHTKMGPLKDLRERIHAGVMETPLQVKDVEKSIDLFFESMRRCKKLVTQMGSEKDTRKLTILEMDLEEEIAFQIVLKQTLCAWSFYEKQETRLSKLQAIIDQYLRLC